MIRAVKLPKAYAMTLIGAALIASTTGCGGPMQAGAAVVTGSQRTTDGEIQSQVADFQSFAATYGLPEAATTTGLPQATVDLLIQEAVWQQVASDYGVEANADRIAQERSMMVADARHALASTKFSGTDAEAMSIAAYQQKFYVAPRDISAYVTAVANSNNAVDAIAAKAGLAKTDANYQVKMSVLVPAALDAATKELKIKVSPRYGTFDATRQGVVTALPSWIHVTAAAADSAGATQ